MTFPSPPPYSSEDYLSRIARAGDSAVCGGDAAAKSFSRSYGKRGISGMTTPTGCHFQLVFL